MLTEQEVENQLTSFYRTMDETVEERAPAWHPGLSRLRGGPSWRVQLMATAALLVLAIGVGFLIREARLIKPTSPVSSPRAGSAQLVTPVNPVAPIGLLSDQKGWEVSGQSLNLTSNGGRSWHDITPANSQGNCCTVFFVDPMHGWAGSVVSGVADAKDFPDFGRRRYLVEGC